MVKLSLISILINNHFFPTVLLIITLNSVFKHKKYTYVIKNLKNNYVIASEFLDIRKNISELSTIVYQIKGLLNGKTLLPFPEVLVFLNSLLHFFLKKNI